ncbi:MAG: PmoA family protein [Verrucomicrobiaceae bacterium]|nr:PmoA family protein [Verrucomicrobiaceae bacterium]
MIRILSFILLVGTLSAQTVTLTEDPTGLRIDVDGRPFTQYRTSGSQRPHLYPVIGPNDVAITREYPWSKTDDHPHHSSIWIGHGKVNDTDFWLDGDENGRIQHTGFKDVTAAGSVASFTASSKWINPNGTAILQDERHIKVTALPQNARIIDITVMFEALDGEVIFQDTKEGTMAIRVAPVLSIREGTGKIITSAGIKNKKAWGTKAEWVSFYGPDPSGKPVSITMMDHPANLRHPTTWHARDYGLFAANPFGLHDFEKSDDETKGNFTLAPGSKLTQRYRILLQAGEPDLTALKQQFAEFTSAK